MEYTLGLLTAVVFFIVFYIGYKAGSKKQPKQHTDDEQMRRSQQIQKEFQAVFNYDLAQALQRKKV